MAREITITFGMRVVFPKRLSRRERETVRRLAAAADYLDRNRHADADPCNLADVTDAIESLASTVRRAKASAHNR